MEVHEHPYTETPTHTPTHLHHIHHHLDACQNPVRLLPVADGAFFYSYLSKFLTTSLLFHNQQGMETVDFDIYFLLLGKITCTSCLLAHKITLQNHCEN